MKKNPLNMRRSPHEVKKILQKMRITVLFVLLFCFYAEASSQKVSLRVKNMNLYTVLLQLKNQTGVRMLYDADYTKQVKCADVSFHEESIKDVLSKLLEKTNLTFKEVNGVFVISKEEAKEEQKKLSGTVKDKQGIPLPGVTVVIKGTTTGVSTDSQGKFVLNIQAKERTILVFSFVGMKTKEIVATPDKPMNIIMEEEIKEMEEVVITGYQVIDRKKSTSAITSVKAEELMIPSATSIDQMLEGRIPDLLLTVNSGEVGVVPRLRIRGTSTLIGNREPLWVVDGIVVQDPVPLTADVLNDPDYVNRIGNAIAGINPQDIDRLDVLKDASATALYGAKAANGVIVITTKKGHIGRPTIRYNTTISYKRRPRYSDRKINLMNSRERIDLSRDLAAIHYKYSPYANVVGYELLLQQLYNKEISQDKFNKEVARLETVNTDWFDLLTDDALSHQHTLSLSGGSNDARYYTSIGYTRDNDVIRNAYNERYTVAMNLNANLTPWLKTSLGINGYINTRDYAQGSLNPIDYAYNTSRAIPAYREDGNYDYYQRFGTSNNKYNFNILNELDNSYTEQKTNSLSFNTNIQVRFTEWLNTNITLSYSTSNTEIEGFWGEETHYAANLRGANYGEDIAVKGTSLLPFGGELSKNNTSNDAYTIRAQLNLNKYFGEDNKHNINASFGYELSSSHYESFSTINRGYYPKRGKKFASSISNDYVQYITWLKSNTPTISDNITNLMAAYGTISYSFRNIFTVNANTRYDGSNKFGSRSNEKLLPIWSVSSAWNLSEHEFFKVSWIDYLSLKISYGYQGNMLDGQSPVMLIRNNPIDTYYNKFTSSVSTYANPKLRWEKTGSFNAGTEIFLFNRRLQLSGDWYYKRTTDAFMDKPVSSINGQTSYTVNSGKVINRGFNISVTATPVRTKDVQWSLSTSYSKTKNEMTTEPGQETYELSNFLNGTALIKGKAVGTFYSYKFIGLNPLDGGPMFDDYEDRIDELKGLGKYDTFTKVLTSSGRREPIISGSLNNTITWKNIRIGLTLAYSLGAKTRLFKLYNFNNANSYADLIYPEDNINRTFINRWQKPGDEAHTNIPAFFSQHNPNYYNYSMHYSTGYGYPGVKIADNAWDMYNYGNQRVVSANYLKCSQASVTYRFSSSWMKKAKLSNLEFTLSGSNLFTLCDKRLKGQTPTQGGFSEIQLSERPSISFSLNVSF